MKKILLILILLAAVILTSCKANILDDKNEDNNIEKSTDTESQDQEIQQYTFGG